MKAKQCFYIDLALRYGVEEAIILQCLREWLQERKANDDYLYRDNRGWLKLSIKQFQAEMPYFSAFKICNASPTTANLEQYMKIIKKEAIKRQLLRFGREVMAGTATGEDC